MRRFGACGVLIVTVLGLVGCSGGSDDGDEPCVTRLFNGEANVAITEELIALAHGAAATSSEDVRAITDAVNRYYEEHHLVDENDTCGPDLDWAADYLRTIEYLIAHPEHASPETLAALVDAADPRRPSTGGGINGIYNFLHDDRLFVPDYPGLQELRDALFEQKRAANDLADEIAKRAADREE